MSSYVLGRENVDGICLGMFTQTMTNAGTCPQQQTLIKARIIMTICENIIIKEDLLGL